MLADRDHEPCAGDTCRCDGETGRTPAATASRLEVAMRMLDAAEAAASPAQVSAALTEVARSHREMGQLDNADWYIRQALRWARTLGSSDGCVDLLCESAELALAIAAFHDKSDAAQARAAKERARDHSFEAARLAEHCADPQWEVSVLLRISEVLESCGDHEDALALHCRALHLIVQDEIRVSSSTANAALAPHSTM